MQCGFFAIFLSCCVFVIYSCDRKSNSRETNSVYGCEISASLRKLEEC